MDQVKHAVNRLRELCSFIPALISAIPEEHVNYSPAEGKWSKKQILGHLIDSAANNHQRFVRIQYQPDPVIYYDQNEWNDLQDYANKDTGELIQLWKLYNLHLAHIANNIPTEALGKTGLLKTGEKFTLEWYITDYVVHLEHHLHQLVEY